MSKKINPSDRQEQQLKLIKRKHKSSLIRDRAHAVLLRNHGFTISDTAKALFRSEYFVKQAIKRFNKSELDKTSLTSHNHRLLKEQKSEIIKMLQHRCPKELKGFNFKTQFWSTDILKKVIKRKYGIEYKTDKSYHALFKEAGFSFQKPQTRDFRQDPEKIKKFKGALKKAQKQQGFGHLGRR